MLREDTQTEPGAHFVKILKLWDIKFMQSEFATELKCLMLILLPPDYRQSDLNHAQVSTVHSPGLSSFQHWHCSSTSRISRDASLHFLQFSVSES